MAANGADEARDRTGLTILDLAQHGRHVERSVDELERTTAELTTTDWGNERHFVSIGELVAALDVLAVHGIEKAGRLGSEIEPRPDVLHARHVRELDLRTPGTLTEPGKEANGDAHGAILPIARTEARRSVDTVGRGHI